MFWYLNGMLTNEEAIQELPKLARDIAAANDEGVVSWYSWYIKVPTKEEQIDKGPDNSLMNLYALGKANGFTATKQKILAFALIVILIRRF